MEMEGLMSTLVVIGGPLLIGIFLFIYGRRRKLNRIERQAADQAAHENWGKERIH